MTARLVDAITRWPLTPKGVEFFVPFRIDGDMTTRVCDDKPSGQLWERLAEHSVRVHGAPVSELQAGQRPRQYIAAQIERRRVRRA